MKAGIAMQCPYIFVKNTHKGERKGRKRVKNA